MSDTGELSAKELVAFIAPPRTIKMMVNEVAEATGWSPQTPDKGLNPRLVEGAWHGEQVSRRTAALLRAVALQKLELADLCSPAPSPMARVADALRDQAGRMAALAGELHPEKG